MNDPREIECRKPSAWWWLGGAVMAITFLLAAFAGLLYWIHPPAFYPRPDFPRLEAQGDTLIAAIEHYQSKHGHYPETLNAAGVSTPRTGWGRWRYVIRPDGRYQLSVGRYDRHG